MVCNLTSAQLSEDPNTLPHRSWMTFLQRCCFCPCAPQTWYSLDCVWKFGLLQFYWAYISAHLMSTGAFTVMYKTLFADWKFNGLALCMPSGGQCHRNGRRRFTAILYVIILSVNSERVCYSPQGCYKQLQYPQTFFCNTGYWRLLAFLQWSCNPGCPIQILCKVCCTALMMDWSFSLLARTSGAALKWAKNKVSKARKLWGA